MGTNYYVAKDRCECCGRYDEEYHIGKASYGWSFLFHGYRMSAWIEHNLTTWQEWKRFLQDKTIVDEYGDLQDYNSFVQMIETWGSPGYVNPANNHKNLDHNQAGRTDKRPWFNPRYDWDDPQGYSFSSREFR